MPLDTKVRYKLGQILLVLLFFLNIAIGSAPKCNKTPLGQTSSKTSGNMGFYVEVAGSPRLYRPGQTYTVTLAGERMDEGDIEPKKIKFIDFMIVAESDLPSTEVSGLGTFQTMPGDAMSKFSHKCSHAVMATSALSKEEVHVLWTAPDQGSGCIKLKAMVVERNDFWFMDDGALTYMICEDDSPMATPPIVEPCKACDEAKYEVIFEGLWSRHTHPKDFPSNEWQTQFSHMIGASHSIDYDLWKYGEHASPALQMLAETGQTKKLEIDMKRFSKNIRSVIKARGLQQRSNVVGRTFAVFRMDATKHLLSLVSKIIPSPDWIVGVSMENLCLSNGSWVDSRIVDLYPWDAGSNSGLSYQDAGEETQPPEAIHRITSCNPDDERSPFFDATCAPVKPVARLHILKQREYKKECAGGDALPLNPSWGSPNAPSLNGDNVYAGTGIGPNNLPESATESQYAYGEYGDSPMYEQSGYDSSYGKTFGGYGRSSNRCDVTQWTAWSDCSQTCDSGSQSRERSYHNEIGAEIDSCKTKIFEKRTCKNLPKCEVKSYSGSFDPFFSEKELSGFTSQWSNRGLSSKSLMKASNSDDDLYANSKSYLYEGNSSPQVGSPNYDWSSDPYTDPYSDPYDKYSGYTKQKGYPPKHNHPSSSRYNPYKDMGYYGYTYGGPPTGRFNQPSYVSNDLDDEDREQSDATPLCEVTDWGDWSHCSTNCGTGTRTRTRDYAEIMESSSCSKELFENDSCEERSGCSQDIIEETTQGPRMRQPPIQHRLPTPRKQVAKKRRQFNHGDLECEVADWTEWSPCSVTCDNGYKIRTRVYKMPFVLNRVCDNKRLIQKMDCRLTSCWGSDSDYYDQNDSPPPNENEYSLTDDSGPMTIQIVEKPNQPYCNEEPNPGYCKVQKDQWFFNATEGRCKRFIYTGCGGNKNNFATEEECLDVCHPNSPDKRFNSLKSLSLVREDYLAEQPQQSYQTGPRPVDCQVSEWSDWTACSASCGRGWVSMQRTILSEPQHGGRACPRKLIKRKKCKMIPCAANPSSWYQGNWRMLQDKTQTIKT